MARTQKSAVQQLNDDIVACRACPRLIEWCQSVAETKRAAYIDDDYWGKPVPSFGVDDPKILIVGLAPGAHGANRTGRMFTGDRSGDWLYAALHRAGLANQPTSTSHEDGLHLANTRITAAVHCAPPDNKPTTVERNTCATWLNRELELLLPELAVVLALGSIAWNASLAALKANGLDIPRPKPTFGHGAIAAIGPLTVIGSYHPSQQNTFTGKLTEEMLDEVFARAKSEAGLN